MEQEVQSQTNQSTQNQPAPFFRSKFSKHLLMKITLIILGIVIMIEIIGFTFLYKKFLLNQNKSSQSATLKPIFQQIQTRSNVDNLKNVNQNGHFSSGFMDPNIFTKKPLSNSSLVSQIYAQEINKHLFFFYTDKQKVFAYDIATGAQHIVLTLTDIPNISIKNGASIYQIYFLNSSKRFIFFLTQGLDDNHDKFKSSIDIYDPETRQVNEVVSATSGGGSIASWSNLAISPDENYLFAFYNNQEQQDPFGDVVAPSKADLFAQTTYFMYNLKTNSLNKFKLAYKLSGPGTVKSGWAHDNSSVLLGYTSPLRSFSTVFLQIYPTGQANVLTDNTSGLNHYLQVAYNNDSKNVYYIGSANTDDNASVFGYFDPTQKTFTTITPNNLHSLNFIYDFSKGYIFDTYQQISYDSQTSGITNRVLNYYDLQSKIIRQLSNQSFAFVNFDGDYSHILVATTYGTDPLGAKLYDLDINTGSLTYLNTAPVVFSVYGSDITPINITTVSPLPTLSQIPTTNPTKDWKEFTIKTVNITLKLPPQLSKLGELKEEVVPGQQGSELCVKFPEKTSFIPKAYAGGGCFSSGPFSFGIGTTSIDYQAGRGGLFLDLQGFNYVNGKYFAKFVNGTSFEIPSDLVQKVSNINGVEIIKIKGKSSTEGEFRGPIGGTPGDGWIGALINTKNSTYTGLAVQMELKDDLTEQLFDQILSTFRFN